jgi:3-deoxy-7-phosphoheptulonate synthase
MQENHTQNRLMSPAMLFQACPSNETAVKKIQHTRDTARKIIHGQDQRMIVITGPCSIHDINAAFEFAELLQQAAKNFIDDLLIIMRVYFEKPRTTTGWKGFINDPKLDGSFDINQGLLHARKLLADLSELGVPAGTEFLNPIIPQYLIDLISWSAIGARTAESQLHRELASGLVTPVGFKNNTDGNVQIAIDAVNTARQPQHFIGIDEKGAPSIVSTKGNDCCHIILRGGNAEPNYSAIHVLQAAENLKKAHLIPRLMVDCSHGNSMKQQHHQITAAKSVIEQITFGSSVICGVMIESHLVAGNQRLQKNNNMLTYGQSITDECISWKDMVLLLEELAFAVRKRRQKAAALLV